MIPISPKNDIVHVANSFAVGGTERQLRTLALGLAADAPDLVQHFALTKYDASDTMDAGFRAASGQFQYVNIGDVDSGQVSDDYSSGLTVHGIRAIKVDRVSAYRRIFERIRPCAVIVWKPDTAALIAAVLEGVDTVLFRAGSIAPVERPFATEIERAEYAYMSECFLWLRQYKNVWFVANSAVARQQFIERMHWPEQASSVLYNAFDTTAFSNLGSKAVSRQKLGLHPDALIVGGSFRLSPEKQPLLWLASAEKHLHQAGSERSVFAIAGGGAMYDQMNAWIQRRGLSERIVLLNELTDTIADFYNAIDVLLHTSAFEGLPNSVVEAQWLGVPVVATRAGGTEEAFVPGRTGILVTEPTSETIAAAIGAVVANIDDYQSRKPEFKQFVSNRFSAALSTRFVTSLMRRTR